MLSNVLPIQCSEYNKNFFPDIFFSTFPVVKLFRLEIRHSYKKFFNYQSANCFLKTNITAKTFFFFKLPFQRTLSEAMQSQQFFFHPKNRQIMNLLLEHALLLYNLAVDYTYLSTNFASKSAALKLKQFFFFNSGMIRYFFYEDTKYVICI